MYVHIYALNKLYLKIRNYNLCFTLSVSTIRLNSIYNNEPPDHPKPPREFGRDREPFDRRQSGAESKKSPSMRTLLYSNVVESILKQFYIIRFSLFINPYRYTLHLCKFIFTTTQFFLKFSCE